MSIVKRTTKPTTRKTFYKKIANRKKALPKRSISRARPKSVSTGSSKKSQKSAPQKSNSDLFSSLTTSHSPRPNPASKPKKHISPKLDQTSPKPHISDNEISALKRLIEQTSSKLEQLEQKAQFSTPQPEKEDPEVFNGIDTDEEQDELIQAQLTKLQKENSRLKHQLKILQDEFTKEKTALEKQTRELKRELHRTTPIHDNKLFSLSKELKKAVQDIQLISDSDVDYVTPPPITILSADSQETSTPVQKPSNSKEAEPSSQPKKTKTIKLDSSETSKDNKSPKKKAKGKDKKLLITGGAVIALLFLGGVASFQFARKPKVNQELIDDYLANNGQIQGVQDTQRKHSSYQDVDKNKIQPFDETRWEDLKITNMGIRIKYPIELVEHVHTQTSITFLRKDSYILKITKHSTDQSLEDFWEEIKDKGLKYTATPQEFHGREALLLTLEETTTYPGNKYLIKGYGEEIYELWFATNDPIYSEDDIKRAQYMLDSFAIL